MRPWRIVVGGLVAALTACGGVVASKVLEESTQLDVSICEPDRGPFTLDITNPYFPMLPGHQIVLEGPDGSGTGRVQITVLDDIKVVAGVETRVVEEREWFDDQLTEVSRNYFVQASDGSICYYGEEVDDYRNGEMVGHSGAWLAGENGALPGILMPGNPEVGTSHAQEVAPGVAEDAALIVEVGVPFTTPGGSFDDTLVAQDVDPLGGGIDPKRYARGVGLIVDEGLVLMSFTS